MRFLKILISANQIFQGKVNICICFLMQSLLSPDCFMQSACEDCGDLLKYSEPSHLYCLNIFYYIFQISGFQIIECIPDCGYWQKTEYQIFGGKGCIIYISFHSSNFMFQRVTNTLLEPFLYPFLDNNFPLCLNIYRLLSFPYVELQHIFTMLKVCLISGSSCSICTLRAPLDKKTYEI